MPNWLKVVLAIVALIIILKFLKPLFFIALVIGVIGGGIYAYKRFIAGDSGSSSSP